MEYEWFVSTNICKKIRYEKTVLKHHELEECELSIGKAKSYGRLEVEIMNAVRAHHEESKAGVR